MSAPSPAPVSLYDARPFFEKALQYGLQNSIIDSAKLEAINTEAPKGIVQIARYFGSEFLRPELEKARDRIVNLVSLYLENSTGGDLRAAAESLRDHSFLSRSKGGSDMLKNLLAMPQNSHFGMNEHRGFTDDMIPQLAKWTLRSLPEYQVEFALRNQVGQVIDAAVWLADELGMDADELEEAGKDAEAVIRTALLVMATGGNAMPDWVAFEKIVQRLRKKHDGALVKPAETEKAGKGLKGAKAKAVVVGVDVDIGLETPQGLPDELKPVVDRVRASITADLVKLLDAELPARQLFDRTPAFMGRYFWVEDGLSEVGEHDREVSAAWARATGGNTDDGSLLTLFLCVAAGSAPKTVLTEKAASTLLRKIQKTGLQPEKAQQYITENAPAQYQDDYIDLWENFIDESQATLESDAAYALNDALALLRRECHVKA
ncbi:MAG: hypothetical protein EOO28_13590 [Comamonadaceae bacterium]|nr:MAG: hypothetical protein EOO28_13590 [Comamonadaceae bacterium]